MLISKVSQIDWLSHALPGDTPSWWYSLVTAMSYVFLIDLLTSMGSRQGQRREVKVFLIDVGPVRRVGGANWASFRAYIQDCSSGYYGPIRPSFSFNLSRKALVWLERGVSFLREQWRPMVNLFFCYSEFSNEEIGF